MCCSRCTHLEETSSCLVSTVAIPVYSGKRKSLMCALVSQLLPPGDFEESFRRHPGVPCLRRKCEHLLSSSAVVVENNFLCGGDTVACLDEST